MLRRAGLNISAQVVGMAIAFFSTPLIIRSIGNDQFGLLTILWALVGYFSVFDLGSGLGLLKFLPDSLARGDQHRAVTIVRCSTAISFGIGVIASLAVTGIAFIGAEHFVRIDAQKHSEVRDVLLVLSLGLPAVLAQVSLKGVVMSYDRYDVLNIVQVASGIIQWGGGALAVMLGGGLMSIVVITVTARYLSLAAYSVFAGRFLPGILSGRGVPPGSVIRELLHFGSWASVPQLVAPLLTLVERAIIGIFLSLAVVPYFSVPNDTVIRLLIVPVGVVSAIMPSLSASWALGETRYRAIEVYRQALKLVILTMIPACVVLGTFSGEILNVWLGADFSRNATAILVILSAGLLFNSISQIPNALLLAAGRPDLPGKIQIVQLPLYFAFLFLCIWMWGILGAAIAWAIRVSAEMIVYLSVARRALRVAPFGSLDKKGRSALGALGVVLTIIIGGRVLTPSVGVVSVIALAGLSGYVAIVWKFLLSPDERNSIVSLIFRKRITPNEVRSE